jgi:hypothetical protein
MGDRELCRGKQDWESARIWCYAERLWIASVVFVSWRQAAISSGSGQVVDAIKSIHQPPPLGREAPLLVKAFSATLEWARIPR